MTITTVGIDLAKNMFAVHGVDQNGKAVLIKSRVTRTALPGLIAGLPPCVIGMAHLEPYNFSEVHQARNSSWRDSDAG